MLKEHTIQLADVYRMQRHIRPLDAEEIMAGTGRTVIEALSVLLYIDDAMAVYDDDVLLAFYGCSNDNPDDPLHPLPYGVPWMFGTRDLAGHGRELNYIASVKVAEWTEKYGALSNRVDGENRVAVRWLQRLGFRVEEPGIERFRSFGTEGVSHV